MAKGHLGVAPPGTITGGLGLKGRPMGWPEEFYRPEMGRPHDWAPPSPKEKELMKKSPEIFGHPVAGLLHSDVPGRTDQLSVSVEPGAYVIPADVVSGLGQGNTTAGSSLLAQILPQQQRAAGGNVVPIVAAGGEYIVPPTVVKRIGKGNLTKGHDILDKMVRKIRMSVAKQMMKLPGPRRD